MAERAPLKAVLDEIAGMRRVQETFKASEATPASAGRLVVTIQLFTTREGQDQHQASSITCTASAWVVAYSRA